jgi:hypothetical protein
LQKAPTFLLKNKKERNFILQKKQKVKISKNRNEDERM